jgi:phosphatidate phosphatase
MKFFTELIQIYFPRTFVENYFCNNPNSTEFQIIQSTKSFPSRHAVVTMYSTLFLFWHLQNHSTKIEQKYAVILLQLSFLMITLFASLSRISDHMNFWWDVLGGFSIAGAFAWYTVRNFDLLQFNRTNY